MIDFEQKKRIKKIQGLEYRDAEKQIFEWIKTGVITLRQFRELNEANNENSPLQRLIDKHNDIFCGTMYEIPEN